MPRLPIATRRRSDVDAEIIRRIDQAGVRQRAVMLLDWSRARDERARQTEQEALRPSARVEPPKPKPWWADLPPVPPPEPAPESEPFHDDFDGYDFDDEANEAEAAPGEPTSIVEPVDAIAERLKGLNHAQLRQVAAAISEDSDDEEGLRQALASYPDAWANDAADDARDDPEAAREAARREAIGFLAEEIENAMAAPTAADNELEDIDG